MENSFSLALRALADAVDLHPTAFPVPSKEDSASINFYCATLPQIREMISFFPQTKVIPCTDNGIVYFDLDFGPIKFRCIGHHDDYMMPTIEGNNVKWVIRPEIQKELESATA